MKKINIIFLLLLVPLMLFPQQKKGEDLTDKNLLKENSNITKTETSETEPKAPPTKKEELNSKNYKRKNKRFSISTNILNPFLRSFVMTKTITNTALGDFTNRQISPDFSMEAQFNLHDYASIIVKGVYMPEIIPNPFYTEKNKYYSDSSTFYNDSSKLDKTKWKKRVYDNKEKNFFNSYFKMDLATKILLLGKGLSDYNGLYLKLGLGFGMTVYTDIYISESKADSVVPVGSVPSAEIPYLYPREVENQDKKNELVAFSFEAFGGLGWQAFFESGFYLDLGIDFGYNSLETMVSSVPHLIIVSTLAVGYSF